MKMTSILLAAVLWVVQLNAQNNPVIVELFTSQGCSSCPSADLTLTEILHEARKKGTPIYGLSFHVDYWNYIGWKDPYSSKAFTERQSAYGKKMGLESIYTPQMIVNGRSQFVGSNRSESAKAIGEALLQKPAYEINIETLTLSDGVVRLSYSLNKKPAGETVNMAIVERDIENYVPRGENSGRKLPHNNVVRAFSTHPLNHNQEIQLRVPVIDPEKASLILYIQDVDWHIIGCTSKALAGLIK